MKYRVVLFQPYLRKHITNFGKYLKNLEYSIQQPTTGNFYQSQLPQSYEEEIRRVKTNKRNTIRRWLGIINVRIKLKKEADIFFTYGTMLITNAPYCVYVENGVVIYNYDARLAAHPFGKFLFSILIRSKSCKAIIFMSVAAQKSFLSSVSYSKSTIRVIQKKSVQIYPLIGDPVAQPKRTSNTLRLLFAGIFYMKGGMELINAFESIRAQYKNIELTIVTPLQIVKKTDIERMQSIQGITLLDATLGEAEMKNLYNTHDIFLLPTYRDSFGLVLIEGIAHAMPIICTDQYATTEVAIDGYNAFVYPNHPLKDYDTKSFKMLGKYRHPKDFYTALFLLQKEGKLKNIENFLYESIEQFIVRPNLLEVFSRNSLELYNKKFHQDIISDKMEKVFLEAIV